MIAVNLSPLANHLWQSTLFAVVAWLITQTLRNNRAAVRYGVWLAASVKFLIPFSLLVSAGSQFEWRTAAAIGEAPLAVVRMSQPFTASGAAVPMMAATRSSGALPVLLFGVWLCGFAISAMVWIWWWLRFRSALRLATPLRLDLPIPVMSSPTRLEPGVFGIRKPILLLPEGIANRLTGKQLQSILAHELCHVRRHDNLAGAVHMVVESIFWFHPLVWWIGSRLVEERERACDEEVVRLGNEPQAYAEGILNVCKFYLQSPLACASGVTGSDLKKRIEAIVNERISHRLTLARKLVLAVAGIAAVGGPVVVGMLHAPAGWAQTNAEVLAFEVASVRPSDPNERGVSMSFNPQGGFTATNVTLKELISAAYGIPCDKSGCDRLSGGPAWMAAARFDVVAKAPQTPQAARQVRQRLQTLLGERFRLAVRRETKELPVYHLVVAENGPKFEEYTGDAPGGTRGGRNGEVIVERGSLPGLVGILTQSVGRPVIDQTGLKGRYSFKLHWTPDPGSGPGPAAPGEKTEGPPASESGPSIFTALREQLGLKLESRRGPVESIVVERAEKPTEN